MLSRDRGNVLRVAHTFGCILKAICGNVGNALLKSKSGVPITPGITGQTLVGASALSAN